MSDDKDLFGFKSLSDDEELDRLLESVRRDIGEASPQPSRPAKPEQPREPEAVREPAMAAQSRPAAETRRAPRAQQIHQARPNSVRAAAPKTSEAEAPAEKEPERELPPQRERIRVVHPEDEKPAKKKGGRFGLAFGIYTVLLVLILAAGCVVLWFYLDAYEATRPDSAMDEFTELADEAYWSDAVAGAFNVAETPFENRDELMEELCMSVLRSNPLVYREDESWSETNLVYMVSAGGTDVCRVTLGSPAEGADAGFGFTYLAVTRVELLASFTSPAAHEITITAPADAEVAVNGVALTEEYAYGELDPTAALIPDLEAGRADELFTVYTVTGLYAPVEVYCSSAAQDNAVEGSSVTFPLGEGSLSYRILAPEGSSVSVNGVELADSYNTGELVTPAFLADFDNYGGKLPELELWTVDGLHLAPEIVVTDANGAETTDFAADGNELSFFPEGDSTFSSQYGSQVRDFIDAYINYLTGEDSADYDALQAMVLDGSALEAELEELNASYAGNGLLAEHVYVRGDSFQRISSTCFAASIDVEYSDAEGEEVNEVYTVVYVMYGGRWFCANVVS